MIGRCARPQEKRASWIIMPDRVVFSPAYAIDSLLHNIIRYKYQDLHTSQKRISRKSGKRTTTHHSLSRWYDSKSFLTLLRGSSSTTIDWLIIIIIIIIIICTCVLETSSRENNNNCETHDTWPTPPRNEKERSVQCSQSRKSPRRSQTLHSPEFAFVTVPSLVFDYFISPTKPTPVVSHPLFFSHSNFPATRKKTFDP